MTTSPTDRFPVEPLENEVEGSLFPYDDDIELTNSNGDTVALLDTESGEITIPPEMEESTEIVVDLGSG